MSKIVVPDGMLARAFAALVAEEKKGNPTSYWSFLESALLWQQENAPRPSAEFVADFQRQCWKDDPSLALHDFGWWFARHMYYAPEPDVPSEISDLLVAPVVGQVNGKQINDRIEKAYRRGQQSKQ